MTPVAQWKRTGLLIQGLWVRVPPGVVILLAAQARVEARRTRIDTWKFHVFMDDSALIHLVQHLSFWVPEELLEQAAELVDAGAISALVSTSGRQAFKVKV